MRVNSAWQMAAVGISALFCAASSAENELLKELEQAFIDLGETVTPSVVEITVESELNPQEAGRLNDLFRQFRTPPEDGEQPEPMPIPRPTSTGSGFIYDTQGHIITNNHVVERADLLKVLFHDSVEREATIVGLDPESDIAVIKVDPQGLDLRPMKMGSSENLRVGQFAVALGSPRGFTGSLSFGHVSGLGREELNLPGRGLRFQRFIQTDAGINLGNSGGPLCNIDGEAIGMNIAIVYGANSIGFAIPVDRIKSVVPQLIDTGSVVRGWLGVSMLDVGDVANEEKVSVKEFIEAHKLPDQNGALVQDTNEEGPARAAGIVPDDLIRSINGQRVTTATDLITIISELSPGDSARVTLWRRGRPIELDVTIARWPGEPTARWGAEVLGIHTTDWTSDFLENFNFDEAPWPFYVPHVVPGSPAEEAGLRPLDMVLEVAQEETQTRDEFIAAMNNARPGRTLLLKIKRLRNEEEPEEENVYIKVPEDWQPNAGSQ